MADRFNAILATEQEGRVTGRLTRLSRDDLPANDVLVEVVFSSLNYKDALAVSGRGRICRKVPLVLGIDMAGFVVESRDGRFSPGDAVLVTGCGIGELRDGGYSQLQSFQGDWLTPVPDTLNLRQAMGIGTAGFTAMLCVMDLERVGIAPARGDVLVTGASGGVGSLAVAILARLGYRVAAATGRAESASYLADLGAGEVIDRQVLSAAARPLETSRWAAALDTVGGQPLANILPKLHHSGAVATCGMVAGVEFTASVMPLILRDVKIMGVNSTHADRHRRLTAWRRLGEILDPDTLDAILEVVPMSDLVPRVDRMLAGRVRGRVVVDVNA